MAGTEVGAIVGSAARWSTGMVLGGAGVAVAFGSASSLPQAMDSNMIALNSPRRITSEFLIDLDSIQCDLNR